VRERLIAHRMLARALQTAFALGVDSRPAGPQDGQVRILVQNAHAMGGIVRTSLNLAAYLSWRRPVEIVSLHRGRDEAFFAFPPGVTVSDLHDRRPGAPRGVAQRILSRVPSLLLHPDDPAHHWFSAWDDVVLLRRIRGMTSGVLITTRPAFSAFAARFAPRGLAVIGQQHTGLAAYTDALRDELRGRSARLAALAVLTRDDERAFAELLRASASPPVVRIPNAVSAAPETPPEQRSRLIMAAGRLTPLKGFDLLLDAFAPVAARHPDWRLAIYGDGPEQGALEARIEALGLGGAAAIHAPVEDLGEPLSRAAIFALSSRHEGFPMVLLEAMGGGLAVASFDCPTGPREAITDGRDGILVPPGDVAAMTEALLALVEDPARRRRLGEAARRTAGDYTLDAIGARWEALLQTVAR
jgi:glycosyltransferase involved in cell wall biosynthesis